MHEVYRIPVQSRKRRLEMNSTTDAAMSANEAPGNGARSGVSVARVDMKLEAVVIPVSDVDRAKEFYGSSAGGSTPTSRFDNGFRVVQFTPPGSGCSVQFGTNITSAAPGSAQGLYLIVSDIEAAREELVARGVEVSEVFHAGTPALSSSPTARAAASRPRARSRQLRLLRHIQRPGRQRLAAAGGHDPAPGRVDPAATSFGSASDLASALGVRRPPTASTRSASAVCRRRRVVGNGRRSRSGKLLPGGSFPAAPSGTARLKLPSEARGARRGGEEAARGREQEEGRGREARAGVLASGRGFSGMEGASPQNFCGAVVRSRLARGPDGVSRFAPETGPPYG